MVKLERIRNGPDTVMVYVNPDNVLYCEDQGNIVTMIHFVDGRLIAVMGNYEQVASKLEDARKNR